MFWTFFHAQASPISPYWKSYQPVSGFGYLPRGLASPAQGAGVALNTEGETGALGL
jgi:hypothetical protein